MARKPEVVVKVSADTKDAQKGLKELSDHSGGLSDNLGKVAAVGATAATAVAAFAAEGVVQFEKLGVSVGKFHDATGISEQDASRLIEVFGDMGISTEDLQGSIGKMEKKLGTNADALDKYGIKVEKNAQGQTDANATFLNAVDALNKITDPMQRNAAGADIFGKSWANMAEAINVDSATLHANLAAVSEHKIFDEEKVRKARELRDAFDSIKDSGEDLFLTIGQALAPVIAKLAPTLVKVVEAAEPLAVAIGDVLGPALELIAPIIEGLMPVIKGLAKALGLVGDAIGWLAGQSDDLQPTIDAFNALADKGKAAGLSTEELKDQMKIAKDEIEKTGGNTDDLRGIVERTTANLDLLGDRTDSWNDSARLMGERSRSAREGLKNVEEQADDTTKKITEFEQKTLDADNAYETLTGHLDEADAWQHAQEAMMAFGEKGADATAQDVRDLTRDLADYVKSTDTIPAEKKTQIYAMLDAGQVDAVERVLANLARNRTANVFIQQHGGAGYNDTGTPHFDDGGVVPGPEGAPVDAVVHGGEVVLNKQQQKRLLSGGSGGPVYIINNFPVGTSAPRMSAEIARRYKKRTGRDIGR